MVPFKLAQLAYMLIMLARKGEFQEPCDSHVGMRTFKKILDGKRRSN